MTRDEIITFIRKMYHEENAKLVELRNTEPQFTEKLIVQLIKVTQLLKILETIV